jgi:hypothetical protein
LRTLETIAELALGTNVAFVFKRHGAVLARCGDVIRFGLT